MASVNLPNVHISKHPLVAHKLSILRDRTTPPKQVREIIHELSQLLLVDATAQLSVVDAGKRNGPLQPYDAFRVKERVALVPIMRSGLGMVDAGLSLLPSAQVYHIGMYREKQTLQPVEYYNKLPRDCRVNLLYLLDPMLATGGTADAAVKALKDWGDVSVVYVCICASRKGIERFVSQHPDVPVFVGTIDEDMDTHGYVLPGIGDTGDRLYNTLDNSTL